MKKTLAIIVLFCAIFFANCSQKNKIQNQTKKKEGITLESEKKSQNVDENFSLFLKTFSQDSIFQVSRVKFPLKTNEWVDPETGMVEKIINKKEYITLDFTYSDDTINREFDAYTQKINITENKCIVEIRGVDNGIYTDFFFEKINGKWILISWDEKST